MKNHSLIINRSNEIYNESSERFGHSSSAVLWDDQQSQYIRFGQITKHINFDENTSILDVGCGNAELYKFLNFNGFKGNYTGFDINDTLLEQAKIQYKNIDCQNVDILNQNINKKYDYVVVSGLFNSNYGQDINWIFEMIKALDQFSNKKIIFNAISNYVNFKDESLFYIDPKEILDFSIQNISSNVSIIHGELPYNFTCIIDKSQQWKSLNRE